MVNQFSLLGALINRNNDGSQEIRIRLALGRTEMDKLTPAWKDKNASIQTNMRQVKALVFSDFFSGLC